VEWTDLFLRQEHPWRKQRLVLEISEADSWRRLRPFVVTVC